MLSGLKLHLSFHFYYFCFFFLFSLYPSLFLFLSISLFLSTSCLSISFSWFHSQVHSSADKTSLLQANTPTPFLSHMLPHVHKHYSHWAHKLFLVHTHSLPLSPSLSMKRHGKFLVLPPPFTTLFKSRNLSTFRFVSLVCLTIRSVSSYQLMMIKTFSHILHKKKWVGGREGVIVQNVPNTILTFYENIVMHSLLQKN